MSPCVATTWTWPGPVVGVLVFVLALWCMLSLLLCPLMSTTSTLNSLAHLLSIHDIFTFMSGNMDVYVQVWMLAFFLKFKRLVYVFKWLPLFFPAAQITALSEATRPVQAQYCRRTRWLAAHPVRNKWKSCYSADRWGIALTSPSPVLCHPFMLGGWFWVDALLCTIHRGTQKRGRGSTAKCQGSNKGNPGLKSFPSVCLEM